MSLALSRATGGRLSVNAITYATQGMIYLEEAVEDQPSGTGAAGGVRSRPQKRKPQQAKRSQTGKFAGGKVRQAEIYPGVVELDLKQAVEELSQSIGGLSKLSASDINQLNIEALSIAERISDKSAVKEFAGLIAKEALDRIKRQEAEDEAMMMLMMMEEIL
jgi:hypothetical protein